MKGGKELGGSASGQIFKQPTARRLAATPQSHTCAAASAHATAPASCRLPRCQQPVAQAHTVPDITQLGSLSRTTPLAVTPLKQNWQRTAVPRVHCLHGEARRGMGERQHKAQGVDGEVQAAPLHRHNVDLLRSAGCGRRNCCQYDAPCEWIPCTATMFTCCTADGAERREQSVTEWSARRARLLQLSSAAILHPLLNSWASCLELWIRSVGCCSSSPLPAHYPTHPAKFVGNSTRQAAHGSAPAVRAPSRHPSSQKHGQHPASNAPAAWGAAAARAPAHPSPPPSAHPAAPFGAAAPASASAGKREAVLGQLKGKGQHTHAGGAC